MFNNVNPSFQVTKYKLTKVIISEEVSDGLLKSHKIVTKRKQKQVQEDNFKVGDLVLPKNIPQEQRKGWKLDVEMLGPFNIIKTEDKSAELVTRKKGKG